uniref:Uncharacterized protein n=1 Tax=Arundo donax TaxID=35708 RepID=A0A0A8Y8U0_ARUDO
MMRLQFTYNHPRNQTGAWFASVLRVSGICFVCFWT